MREKLAKAATAVLRDSKGLDDKSCLSEEVCEWYPCACVDGVVDAILEALAEPSEAMLRAGRKAVADAYPAAEHHDAWQAMIRAVREEQPPGV